MAARVDAPSAPSWFSTIQADNKPVYLNTEGGAEGEGAIKTGGESRKDRLKGCLVSIAESLGIFKDYVSDYRQREATGNRAAYNAVWNFVTDKYDVKTVRETRRVVGREHSPAQYPLSRLKGRNPRDPERAIVGRELRLILDTARSVDKNIEDYGRFEVYRSEVDASPKRGSVAQQQGDGTIGGISVRRKGDNVAQQQGDGTIGGAEVSAPVATDDDRARPSEWVGDGEREHPSEWVDDGDREHPSEWVGDRPEPEQSVQTVATAVADLDSTIDNTALGLGDEHLGDEQQMTQLADPEVAPLRAQLPLPNPQNYKGTNYFDQSDTNLARLPMQIINRNAAKQVATDKALLAASMPESSAGKELTPKQCAYIKTTLTRQVAELGNSKPNERLDAKALYGMMVPITAQALEQNDRTLGAKVLYKNVVKHIGRKEAPVRAANKELQQQTRAYVNARIGKHKTGGGADAPATEFIKGVANRAKIPIEVDNLLVRLVRSDVKEMAGVYVKSQHQALTEPTLEAMIEQVLREQAQAHGQVS